jgi:hypothetical protein
MKMPVSRQLAAIMFTEIVGYTALMGEDEDKAFELLRKNRKIQQPIIEGLAAAWSGDLDVAFSYMEKSYEEHEAMLLTLKTWPNVPDNLKNDPRCQELIKRIGFPG